MKFFSNTRREYALIGLLVGILLPFAVSAVAGALALATL